MSKHLLLGSQRRNVVTLQATLLQACCVILIFLIISVVSMVSLMIYLSQCTHAMTSGMTWGHIIIMVSPADIITLSVISGCKAAKTGDKVLIVERCAISEVITEQDFLQDGERSRQREQWARDFDKVIQHPRIPESMFVQKGWTQSARGSLLQKLKLHETAR